MPRKMREMVGGCCVCSDERGWDENPLVYCDGQGCNVAVHQACYGIVSVPTGPWYCRKCESQERSARVRCELCPNKDGALKRTDSNSWAHVVCALYIPEVRFGNVATVEPIVLGLVPQDRYQKICYLCEQQGRESRASSGACMQCNRLGCKQTFHVTCAQSAGMLCEEAGNYSDNVKYCGYCDYHYQRINKKVVKTIPAFKPQPSATARQSSDDEAGSSSPAKSPKEAGPGSNSVAATQGRNSSMSTSSSSSKKGKKGRRTNQGIPSSTTESPKSDSEKATPLPSSPTSTSTSSLKRSQSEDETKKEDHSTKATEKETAKISTTSGPNSSVTSDKNNDVSSSAEVTEKKPPSVIVKFGKQDGTYYSKKHEPSHLSSSTNSNNSSSSKKDKDKKHSDATTSSSSGSNSTNTVSNSKDAKDSGSGGVNTSVTSASSRENNDKKYSSDGGSKQSQKGFTRASFTGSTVASTSSVSATMFSPSHDIKEESGDQNEKSIKTEPMDVDSQDSGPAAKKLSSVTISATVDQARTPNSSLNQPQSLSSSSSNQKNSSCSVTLEKSKTDLKNTDGKVKTTNTNAGSVSTLSSSASIHYNSSSSKISTSSDRQTHPQSSEKTPDRPPPTKDSPAKIIPILPPTSNSNYTKSSAKIELKSPPPIHPPISAGAKRVVEAVAATSLTSEATHQRILSIDERRAPSPPRINTELISPNTDSKMSMGPERTASGKRLGRPPKKGTHLQSDSLGPMASGSSEKPESHESPDRNSTSGDPKRRKQSPGSRLTNGNESLWMMGATLNPSSSVAKEMDACLKDEIQTHSAYDANNRVAYHGVPFPGAKKNSHKSGSSTSSQVSSETPSAKGPASQRPQTLEELLERQWEQGSQFLMEQASHFDIASLLSSLHQLKEENLELEDSVDRLVQRRDHLLAVRARLMALSSLSSSPTNSSQNTPDRPPAQHTNGPSPASGRTSAHVSPRNSAATVSPIRYNPVERSSTSAATIISPRNLPPPSSMMSPRDSRPMSSSGLPPPPPSHHMHQLPSPRDRVPDRGSIQGITPMENGIDFHPPVSQHMSQHPNPGSNVFISSASHNIAQNRSQVFANSRGGNLLTVVSSANSGVHPGSSSGPVNANMVHHRQMSHHMTGPQPGNHGPPHSPHVQTPPPVSSGQIPQPPPRQSAYPNSNMGGHNSGSSLPPPPSHSSSRPNMHMGHPSHGLPPPPGAGGMMRPPMPHPSPFTGGYHQMSSGPRGPPSHGPPSHGPPSHGPPSHGPPPSHGHPRQPNNLMMAQHMRSSNVMDKR